MRLRPTLSFEDLKVGIQRKKISLCIRTEDLGPVSDDYFAVDAGHFPAEAPLPCAVYFPIVRKPKDILSFVKLAEGGLPYPEKWRLFFSGREIDWLYIKRDSFDEFSAHLYQTTKLALDSPELTPIRKSRMLYDHVTHLAQRAFLDHRLQQSLIDEIVRWSEAAAGFFIAEEIAPPLLQQVFSKAFNTSLHSVRVCMFGMAFCAYLKRGERDIAEFGVGSLLHDIGKVTINNRIWMKPFGLTDEEFEKVREHPCLGYEHLKETGRASDSQLELVLQHHERMDGEGYPCGVTGGEIHPFARITHLIDRYDNLVTQRPYKVPLSSFKALKLMHAALKPSFDLDLLVEFTRFLGE